MIGKFTETYYKVRGPEMSMLDPKFKKYERAVKLAVKLYKMSGFRHRVIEITECEVLSVGEANR